MQVTTIGLDLAKHWFQVHGVDANGAIAIRRKLRRSDVLSFFQSLSPCLIGIEACGCRAQCGQCVKALLALLRGTDCEMPELQGAAASLASELPQAGRLVRAKWRKRCCGIRR
jgi:hypothetical protein